MSTRCVRRAFGFEKYHLWERARAQFSFFNENTKPKALNPKLLHTKMLSEHVGCSSVKFDNKRRSMWTRLVCYFCITVFAHVDTVRKKISYRTFIEYDLDNYKIFMTRLL